MAQDFDEAALNAEQRLLAQRVHLPSEPLELHGDAVLFGIDVQYIEEEAYCAVAAYRYRGYVLDQYVLHTQAGMPYQSGYFCFREGPPILQLIRAIQARHGLRPDLLVVDGHGIAHPRRFGVASWLGVQAGVPSIGVAKRPLLHYEGELPSERGAMLPLTLRGETVGTVLRTQDDIQPLYVSPGHLVQVADAANIALRLATHYRLVEPIRAADHLARAFAKGASVDAFVL